MKPMLIALALSALALPAAAASDYHQTRPVPKKGHNYPECYCTDSTGQRVELGQMSCLSIGSRRVMARCDMSQNNPIWRYQDGGCPDS